MTWECLRLDPNFIRARLWGAPSFAPGEQRLWESHLNNGSWFPVERWLDLPLCEDFQYVVTLREPVPRLLHQCLEKTGWVVVSQKPPVAHLIGKIVGIHWA